MQASTRTLNAVPAETRRSLENLQPLKKESVNNRREPRVSSTFVLEYTNEHGDAAITRMNIAAENSARLWLNINRQP